MTDVFEKDYKQANDYCNRLRTQMGEIRMNKSGSGVTSQKYLMKGTYNTLQVSLQNFDKLVYEYENEPGKYPSVSQREMQKRIAKIVELKKTAEDELFREYKAIENDSAQQYTDMESQRLMRGEDGEYDETRDVDNKGII